VPYNSQITDSDKVDREKRLKDGQVLTLYHQTSPESAKNIAKERKMIRGSSGMAGPAIYFAKSKEATNNRKATSLGAYIKAKVKLGTSKTIKGAEQNTNFTNLLKEGYDSVIIAKSTWSADGSNNEYVVYNWDQVEFLSVEYDGWWDWLTSFIS